MDAAILKRKWPVVVEKEAGEGQHVVVVAATAAFPAIHSEVVVFAVAEASFARPAASVCDAAVAVL